LLRAVSEIPTYHDALAFVGALIDECVALHANQPKRTAAEGGVVPPDRKQTAVES
jgi:hypothetical protein